MVNKINSGEINTGDSPLCFIKSKGKAAMRKRVVIILSIVIGLFLIIGGTVSLVQSSKTNTDIMETGRVTFVYDDLNISECLSDKDLNTLKELFDNKRLYRDNPSCGFSENVSVVFDESEVFCVACDDCPIIYYQNKGLYFALSNQENDLLRKVLIQYGFHFPCV